MATVTASPFSLADLFTRSRDSAHEEMIRNAAASTIIPRRITASTLRPGGRRTRAAKLPAGGKTRRRGKSREVVCVSGAGVTPAAGLPIFPSTLATAKHFGKPFQPLQRAIAHGWLWNDRRWKFLDQMGAGRIIEHVDGRRSFVPADQRTPPTATTFK